MDEAIELARGKDAKQRMAAIERLHHLLESSAKPLSSSETTSIVDCCLDLSRDSNFKVCQLALQSLASAVVLSGDNSKFHFNAIVPVAVERLGDGKQPVRDASRSLLLTLMQVSSPTIIVERAGSYAWMHKNWRIREEFARTVTSAIGLFASTELPLQRAILSPILQMLNDMNQSIREAAMSCIEGMYAQGGIQFRDELQRHHLPISMVKDINARLERIQPKGSSDGLTNFSSANMKPKSFSPKKGSPRAKRGIRDVSLFGAEGDVAEQSVEPLKVYSEMELIRELEKIASALVPEKDWSLRVASMMRVEALVLGGAADYPCFKGLLKQLIGPLSTQLSDRRSSIVKQASHLLCFLSKELLGDFEACAEMFIPVLFKLVVITVLVIAESADNCIKTMLRNCKVSRILPRIADCAMNDRSAVLRARCCEYALLILEQWPDAPEIQGSADLYEELIKCCVSDAMSEVRSTARMCYRMFSKTWPERSGRLFSSFDPSIQKIVKEEDGASHKHHAYPSIRDRSAQISSSHTSSHIVLPGYGTSAIVAMDRSSTLNSGTSLSSGLLLSQAKSFSKVADSSIQTVLNTSKEKVSAIESMLRGLDVSIRNQPAFQSSSLDLVDSSVVALTAGVDLPSSRNPPFPRAVPDSNHLTSPLMTGKRSEKLQQVGSVEESYDAKVGRCFSDLLMDRQQLDYSSRDRIGDLQSTYVPNFQRPLSRKPAAGRMATRRRSSFDERQLSMMDVSSYVEGPTSLADALSEGLSPRSNWSGRVTAFNYIKSLLQQGPKGIQEVLQSFEKVMKLFFQHLDDPHHKVAQGALSTLAEIVTSCRKPFESYMDRMLPHVFSRLVDPKESVRQPCSAMLEIVGKSYSVDLLLPALLRSLDEQRSPKAKLAVIDFAIDSFNKYAADSEGSGNSGILKLWLAKLTPLTCDKNTKLKDAAISCIVSVYSHFDSMAVLCFILSLSIDEQNSLRRALKQNTPRIEVDLMNFLQSKKERQRSKSTYDLPDITTGSYEEDYVGLPKKNYIISRYSLSSVEGNGGRWWNSSQGSSLPSGDTIVGSHENEVDPYPDAISPKILDLKYTVDSEAQSLNSTTAWLEKMQNGNAGSSIRLANCLRHKASAEGDLDVNQPSPMKINPLRDGRVSIPQILHLVSNGNDAVASSNRQSGLQHLIEMSQVNDLSILSKYFNQILKIVLEVLDDSDSSNRELGLLLIFEMLKNQRDMMEDSVEIVIEKLLHVSKDAVAKVSNEAEKCLTSVMSQYDPSKCLSVIVPLLVTEDEKTLVICIKCLTKLVGRLSPKELLGQFPSFLPSLFEAFGNQSPNVRKTVVFCLVDMYIMLGKDFLPYLKGLNSTQLRLVTIYANRISQARTGTLVDTNV